MSPPDLTQALSREWASLNWSVFGNALVSPATIVIVKELHSHLADWCPGTRTIRFSERFVLQHPWWAILEVLKHEMAHQYVSDVLGIEDEETAHGPAFKMVCRRYSIDGRAGRSQSDEERRIVEKARKLMELATSTNEHEARAALVAAQRLLGKHGLAEEDIRERSADEFGALAVGEVRPKIQLHDSALASLLGRHFHVRPIWIGVRDPRTGKDGQQLELIGRRCHLAMAEYVYGWLHRIASQLCPPTLNRMERQDFVAGVIAGHAQQLDEQARSEASHASGISRAMVKSDSTDEELEAHFDRRHPKTRMSRRSRRSVGESYLAGESAGRSLEMRRPIEGSGPKLLK